MNHRYAHKELAEVLYTALTEDAFYIAMEGSISRPGLSAREGMVQYMDFSLREAAQYGVLSEIAEGPIGAGIWSKPMSASEASAISRAKQAFLEANLGANAVATYRTITEFMTEHTAPCVPPGAWYLSILGVAPEHQGRGLGAQLVQPVLDVTDRLAVPTYLETFTPRNKSFYQRLGYSEALSVTEPTTGTDYCVMLRAPKARPAKQ
ncbi:MAG: GNAT family N-acetyltransferase [Gammaproteobacteria bacterium]|nr:GNAT family N-acetyltransferase [Gammaproteobacteria bacterium]